MSEYLYFRINNQSIINNLKNISAQRENQISIASRIADSLEMEINIIHLSEINPDDKAFHSFSKSLDWNFVSDIDLQTSKKIEGYLPYFNQSYESLCPECRKLSNELVSVSRFESIFYDRSLFPLFSVSDLLPRLTFSHESKMYLMALPEKEFYQRLEGEKGYLKQADFIKYIGMNQISLDNYVELSSWLN